MTPAAPSQGGFLRKHRKKLLVGGIAGSLVGGAIGAFVFIAQFELAHIAKLFYNHNFGGQERQEQTRTNRIMQRIFADKSGKKKISTGNPISDKITNYKLDRFENRIKKSGYELRYQNERLTGIYKDGKLVDDLSGSSPKERRRAFNKVINTEIPAWRAMKRFKYRELMRIRAGIEWKFFEKTRENAREKIKEKKRKFVQERSAAADAKLSATRDRKEGEADTDHSNRQGAIDGGSAELNAAAATARDEFNKGATPDAAAKKASGSFKAKAAGVTGLVLASCAIKGYANQAKEQIYETRSVPLMRQGNMLLVAADQLKEGDVTSPEVSEFMKSFHDGDEHFNQSAGYKRATGGVVTDKNPDLSDEAKPNENGLLSLADTINDLPGVPEAVCNVAGSFLGGLVLQVVEIGAAVFTGGVSLIASLGSEAALLAFDKVFPSIVKLFANLTVTGDEKPIAFTNMADAGLNLSKNEYARSIGGRPLTDAEAFDVQSAYKSDQLAEIKSRGLVYRFFSPDHHYSYTAKAIAYRPHSTKQTLMQLASLPKFVMGKLSNSLFGLQPAYADSAANPYGITQYGFTDDEINDSMEPDENADWVIKNISTDEQTKYQACFNDPYEQVKKRSECQEKTEKFKRFRLFKLDGCILDAMTALSTDGSPGGCMQQAGVTNTPGVGATIVGECMVQADTPPNDYSQVTVDGETLNTRTKSMLNTAKSYAQSAGINASFGVIQGSYSSDVAASGNTHKGGGALDISVSGLNTDQVQGVVKALRQAGFAAWYRTTFGANNLHIHAIAIGDTEAHSDAIGQVRAYFAGTDGLGGANDTSPTVGRPIPTWARAFGDPLCA